MATFPVPLLGPDGRISVDQLPAGITIPATNGREVELLKTTTHIQWRYVGSPTWTDLVALVDISGAKGDAGADGREVELQKSATDVQWRYVNAPTWIDLIPLADLKGAQGDVGPAGSTIIGGISGLQSALDSKAPLASPAFTGTPTGITKAHVGLDSVDNTADSAKPVSTAQQTALDLKRDASWTPLPQDVGVTSSGQRVPVSSSQTVWSAGGLTVNQSASASSLAQRRTGGALTVGTPTLDGDAATKLYTDTSDNLRVTKLASANKIYGTDAAGAELGLSYTKTTVANTIPQRNVSGAITVGDGTVASETASKGQLDTALALKADDNTVVKVSGDQSIDGVKTFTSSPVVPTPTTAGQASNKDYVDTTVAAIPPAATPVLIGSSTTSMTVAASGSKVFALSSPTDLQVGQYVRAASTASPQNYMAGVITAISSTSVSINIAIAGESGGSGTYAAWTISMSGQKGSTGTAGTSPSITGTSTTSFTVGTGSKVFVTQSGKAWVVGNRVRIASTVSPTANWMEGVITAYSTTSLTVLVDLTSGSNSVTASWNIALTGNSPYLSANSTSSVAMNTSVASFTTDRPLSVSIGTPVTATVRGFSMYLYGYVDTISAGNTFSMNVASTSGGLTTEVDWVVTMTGPQGLQGPPGIQGSAGTAGVSPVISGTSSSSLVIGLGSKVFTTQAGRSWTVGSRVRVSGTASPLTQWMEGVVSAYASTSLTIAVDKVSGSGATVASWNINITGDSFIGTATSTSSNTQAPGSKTFLTDVPLSVGVGSYVLVQSTVSGAIMFGPLSAVATNSITGNFMLTDFSVDSSGTAYTDWTIVVSGSPGPQGTTGQGVPTGGATGAVLQKTSATNYATSWTLPAKNLSGTYAARPTSVSVPDGSVYYCTNIPEQYLSSGSTWLVVGSGGNELGSAAITTPQSTTGGTKVDVPGLAFTFIAGERPVEIRLDCDLKSSTVSAAIGYILVDNVVVQAVGATGSSYTSMSKSVRKTYTPGSSHTVKVQMDGGGTLTMLGGTDTPSILYAKTL